MDHTSWIAYAVYFADYAIRVGLSVRVIHRRLPVGVGLAWLAVILIFPFVGAVFYLLLGEYRLGRRRSRRAAAYRAAHPPQGRSVPEAVRLDPAILGPERAALARLAESVLGAPVLAGNRLELLPNADAAFPVLIAEIDRACTTCDLEFYIWSPGGCADDLGAALIRATKRGVRCRVLVDAIGSKAFLRSGLCRDLRKGGVQIVAALPAGALSLLFIRPDLRLHRKIVVIDGTVGFTGSLNLADPRLFNIDAGVGQWVDALVRVQGPVVDALADVFNEDWAIESGEMAVPTERTVAPPSSTAGRAAIQVLPTGPDARVQAIEQIVVMALYGAEREVVLTTPYFIPSESLMTALLSAAGRGVTVTLIVPKRVDSRLVHFASRSYQTDLLAAGVQVALYRDGLLHTKSITVDGTLSLFGSLNLDPRSLRLDFEITLAVYNSEFTAALRGLQQQYLDHADLLTLDACRSRTGRERFAEDAARLASPIL